VDIYVSDEPVVSIFSAEIYRVQNWLCYISMLQRRRLLRSIEEEEEIEPGPHYYKWLTLVFTTLGPGVYSASNRNAYQKQRNNVSRE
jgi:hypothetical protein